MKYYYSGKFKNTDLNIKYRIDHILKNLNNIFGIQGLILRASKLDAINLINSEKNSDIILGLQRILYENPTLNEEIPEEKQPKVLYELENKLAEEFAHNNIEKELQNLIRVKMENKYQDYLRDIKIQVLKELQVNPENPETLKKLGRLEKMEYKKLNNSALEVLRPNKIEEVIGQKTALNSLINKLNTPYPQHILLYGPPGVGKTTCARLALELAKRGKHSVFAQDAPFIEVDGTTLRWDPRESTNPLLGSVHDPIYQGAKKELADDGIPEPKLGLVSQAHGGVLFIDEIGEMDIYLQNKLLKVMEDKRVFFDSSYYDPNDPKIPQYIKKIFEKGVPADFILIGATTRGKEEISPAFRSRCMEVFFDPLNREEIKQIVWQSAYKLDIKLEKELIETICNYCNDGRTANKLLIDAYGIALNKNKNNINDLILTAEDVQEAIINSRLYLPNSIKATSGTETGKILGIGVNAYYGSLIEIETVAFKSREPGKGKVLFNATAGSMTQDSVINAGTLFKLEFGEDLDNYDVHINLVGGGKVDGPSAGTAIFLAIVSAVYQKQIWQDVAVTGEISIRGQIKPVGGIYQKIYAAREAGIRKVIIPYANKNEISADVAGIQIITAKTIKDIYEHIFA